VTQEEEAFCIRYVVASLRAINKWKERNPSYHDSMPLRITEIEAHPYTIDKLLQYLPWDSVDFIDNPTLSETEMGFDFDSSGSPGGLPATRNGQTI
jgi:hypothetical protein